MEVAFAVVPLSPSHLLCLFLYVNTTSALQGKNIHQSPLDFLSLLPPFLLYQFLDHKFNFFMANYLGICVVLFVLAGSSSVIVEGRFVVEKSSIRVISPYDLRSSKHDAAIANFGVPGYGGSMIGSVVYPSNASFGCNPFDGDKPFKSKSSHPTILLLDRGGN